MKGLLSGGIVSIIIKVSNVLLGFFTTLVLTNIVDIETFGEYSFWIAVVTVLVLPFQIGFPSLFMRETARGYYYQVMHQYKKFSFIILIIVLLSILISLYLGKVSAAFSILIAYLLSFVGCFSGALRGGGYYLTGQMPENILRQSMFLISISCAYFFIELIEITDLLFLMLISTFVSAFISFSFVQYTLGKQPKRNEEKLDLKKALLYFSFLGGVQVINGQVDIFTISYFNNEDDVALYRVALQISLLVSFGLHAVTMFVAPQLSKLYYSNEIKKLVEVIENAIKLSLAVSLPTLLIVYFFGEMILTMLFGAKYSDGYNVLLILAFAQFIASIFGPQVTILNACGFEKSVFKVTVLCIFLNVFLNLVFVPLMSIEGAALATCISQVIRVYIISKIMKKNFHFKFGLNRLISNA